MKDQPVIIFLQEILKRERFGMGATIETHLIRSLATLGITRVNDILWGKTYQPVGPWPQNCPSAPTYLLTASGLKCRQFYAGQKQQQLEQLQRHQQRLKNIKPLPQPKAKKSKGSRLESLSNLFEKLQELHALGNIELDIRNEAAGFAPHFEGSLRQMAATLGFSSSTFPQENDLENQKKMLMGL